MSDVDLNDLAYFANVVEHGGFAPASRATGVPKSKLSRRVAALEQRLGTQLLMRSTRRFTVTEVGRVYYRHCRAMLVEADAAQEAIASAHAEPCGTVRISCPVALLAARVGAMLAQFMLRYPRVRIVAEETNRRVDVVAEGFDLAIRVRPFPLQDSGLVMRVLSDRGQCLVASPSLLRSHGMPDGPHDLMRFPTLDLSQSQEDHRWRLQQADGDPVEIRHQPRLVTHSMLALREAALAGVGVVQLPRMFIADELARSLLVNVLPGWEPRREVIHVVYASRRGQLPAVRQLIDFLVQAFAALDED